MNRKEIAKACQRARGKKTKYAAAKEAGLTIGQITRIEDGGENYTVDVLNKYLKVLGLKLEVK